MAKWNSKEVKMSAPRVSLERSEFITWASVKPCIHDWNYDGTGGGHRGEYEHSCTKCGAEDWFSEYNIKHSPNVMAGAFAISLEVGKRYVMKNGEITGAMIQYSSTVFKDEKTCCPCDGLLQYWDVRGRPYGNVAWEKENHAIAGEHSETLGSKLKKIIGNSLEKNYVENLKELITVDIEIGVVPLYRITDPDQVKFFMNDVWNHVDFIQWQNDNDIQVLFRIETADQNSIEVTVMSC